MNRLQVHRAVRRKVVFSSTPVPVWLDDPEPLQRNAFRSGLERARVWVITGSSVPTRTRRMTSRRVTRLARRDAFSPLGATIARPLGDAAVTLQILRIR